jgi:urocanate hydratase
MCLVADGSPEAGERLERVLTTDPGLGIVRHADAGYSTAKKIAIEKGIRMPMLK